MISVITLALLADWSVGNTPKDEDKTATTAEEEELAAELIKDLAEKRVF